ncbi:MAG TPA: uroporphyrinogen-III C-methyltransferase, partial [Kofleriaceae bacterium]
LAAADAVAHDALVPPAILALARPGAELVPVGRRHGGGPTSYRLHPAVIARAAAGQIVVRLKAGDPMVFGRGGEEAEELAAAGIPFEIVPGVSAALGAAAYAGIPLTHRDHASDVTFASGHDVDGSHPGHTDWAVAARGTGTLVLFMAARTLAANLARLVASGRTPATPAAYIAAATTPDQRVVTGTLDTLAARVDAAAIDPAAPALVIIGDVVGLRDRLAWFSSGDAPASKGERGAGLAVRHPAPQLDAGALEDPLAGHRKGRELLVGDDAPGRPPPRVDSAPAPAGAPGKAPRGLVVVYTGQGKGKTTAALGLVFRALGRGMRVAVVQFIKGKWMTGERRFAETLPELTFLVMGQGFTWNSDDLSRDRAAAQAAWATAKQLIGSGGHAVVVLDEITFAINYGFVELGDVLAALRDRPPHVHVVATGRNAPEELRAIADLVTDMTCVKHPFERGVTAQPGIDY